MTTRDQKLSTRKRDRKLRSMLCLFDNPILSQPCVRAEGEEAKTIGAILHDALDAFDDAVGLAAPQLGFSKQVLALWPNRHRGASNGAMIGDKLIMVNPRITDHSDTSSQAVERCLSYPGLCATIVRYDSVTVAYTDFRDGQDKTIQLEGWEARVFQHEFDHLGGNCQVKQGTTQQLYNPSPRKPMSPAVATILAAACCMAGAGVTPPRRQESPVSATNLCDLLGLK